jgi:hypothetical protein
MSAGSGRLSSQEQVVVETAFRLQHGLADLASDIRDVIEDAVPALRDPAGERSLLQASIQENIDAALNLLAHGIDGTHVDAPNAAVAHARQLAQRGVSRLSICRAYRIGQRQFLCKFLAELLPHLMPKSEMQAAMQTIARVNEYVDRVIDQVLDDYAKARKDWLDPNHILMNRVRSVLSDPDVTPAMAQDRLGAYRLERQHLCVIVWSGAPEPALDLLRTVCDAFATGAHAEGAPLFVPVDESTACVWLGFAARQTDAAERLASVLKAYPAVSAAIGDMLPALAGFRRTHQQALLTERIARVNTPPLVQVTPYAEIAPIATMGDDLAATRDWVHETLGALAVNDRRHADLRETARVFFETGGSYAATAERLSLHRNTAQYRVRAAEELRGRPFSEDRLDVELALLAAHWFGNAVLQAPAAKHAG